VGGQYNFGGDQ